MDTLVLNAAFMPVDRCSWEEALTAVLSGRAEVVDTYTDWVVRSVCLVFNVPSVIRFLTRAVFHKRL